MGNYQPEHQALWRVWWQGFENETISVNHDQTMTATDHIAYIRASQQALAKVRRYMEKAPGVLDFTIDLVHPRVMHAQEFIDYRRDK